MEKELVILRQEKINPRGSDPITRFYLEYSVDGIILKDYLHAYLIPEKTQLDKIRNEEAMRHAQERKARLEYALQNNIEEFRAKLKDRPLRYYIAKQKEKYEKSGKVAFGKMLGRLLRWLEEYTERITIRTTDKEYILAFLDFLRDNGLAENTVRLYYKTLSTIYNNAIRDGIIETSPFKSIDVFQKPTRRESKQEYLTCEELQMLMDAPCRNNAVKNAFLFSCFAGLRLSEVEALYWYMIREEADGWEVEKRLNKTRDIVYVPLSRNALVFLPPRDTYDKKVWVLPGRSEINEIIAEWVMNAGIKKHISYHCSLLTAKNSCANFNSEP